MGKIFRNSNSVDLIGILGRERQKLVSPELTWREKKWMDGGGRMRHKHRNCTHLQASNDK